MGKKGCVLGRKVVRILGKYFFMRVLGILKRNCPAEAGQVDRATKACYDKRMKTKEAVVKWVSLATAVARRQVPANFASCC